MAFKLLQENGVDRIILEDGSGFLLLEVDDTTPLASVIVREKPVVVVAKWRDVVVTPASRNHVLTPTGQPQ